MNTEAKATIVGLLEAVKSQKLFKKHDSKKQTISKKRAMKDSAMKMKHQCSSRQQFRRKTTPNR